MKTMLFPLLILEHDDMSFRRATKLSDLHFERPDVIEGLFEIWDSQGQHFSVFWDESAQWYDFQPLDEDGLDALALALGRAEDFYSKYPTVRLTRNMLGLVGVRGILRAMQDRRLGCPGLGPTSDR
jgi:hypothetical protein